MSDMPEDADVAQVKRTPRPSTHLLTITPGLWYMLG